jgi:hypothetical protein
MSENLGSRETGWVRGRQTILTLLSYSEGESAVLKKLLGVACSSGSPSILGIAEFIVPITSEKGLFHAGWCIPLHKRLVGRSGQKPWNSKFTAHIAH